MLNIPVEFWVALGAIAVLLNSVVSFATLLYARRTEINTNSLTAALVNKTETEALAKGRLEGRANEKADAVARFEAVAAADAGDAIHEATVDVIEPIAEKAVAEGTKAAIAEAQEAINKGD